MKASFQAQVKWKEVRIYSLFVSPIEVANSLSQVFNFLVNLLYDFLLNFHEHIHAFAEAIKVVSNPIIIKKTNRIHHVNQLIDHLG